MFFLPISFQMHLFYLEKDLPREWLQTPIMMLLLLFNLLGSFLISNAESKLAGLSLGVGSSGLMIGMALWQFQNTGIEYSTQEMTDFFNIYFPSMFLIFGIFQCFYCFLCILKSCIGFWKDMKKLRNDPILFPKNC